MRVQEHIKLSALAATMALPWLGKDVLIPLTSSVVIDVDHYLWHAVTFRTLSLRDGSKVLRAGRSSSTKRSTSTTSPASTGYTIIDCNSYSLTISHADSRRFDFSCKPGCCACDTNAISETIIERRGLTVFVLNVESGARHCNCIPFTFLLVCSTAIMQKIL